MAASKKVLILSGAHHNMGGEGEYKVGPQLLVKKLPLFVLLLVCDTEASKP